MPDGTTILLDGDVGMGTSTPQARLDVNGTIRCVSLTQTSDAQLKTDVQTLGGVLDKLERIRGVSYRWNAQAQSLGARTNARRIGVLAQELEQVFPELVTTPEPVAEEELLTQYSKEMATPELRKQLRQDAERSHYKAVNYGELSAVLLEAVKELNTKAKGLEAENASLRQRMDALEQQMQQLSQRLSN